MRTSISNTNVELTTDIVAAYVSNNQIPADAMPGLIATVSVSLKALCEATSPAIVSDEAQKPAVPVKKSVTPDYIVSLEDGRKFRSLKRHLMAHYGMTPDEYRTKWNLPKDYPMVAPNYAAYRSSQAKAMGLGRKPGEKPKSRRRKKSK